MSEKLKAITDKTLIPISMVLTIIGGVAWLTTLYNETKAHGTQINDLWKEQEQVSQKIDRVLEKLNRIEGKLYSSRLRVVENQGGE